MGGTRSLDDILAHESDSLRRAVSNVLGAMKDPVSKVLNGIVTNSSSGSKLEKWLAKDSARNSNFNFNGFPFKLLSKCRLVNLKRLRKLATAFSALYKDKSKYTSQLS